MTNRLVPVGFVKTVLQNGVGRQICLLQRLTLKFCKSMPNSRGMRDFIENDLLEFTRENPGVVVYIAPRRHNSPKLVAEYLNGSDQTVPVSSYSRREICEWVGHLRDRSGVDLIRLQKQQHTDTPSIQGPWTPFTNRPTHWNVTEFPGTEETRILGNQTSATSRLLERARQLRAENTDS